VDAARPLFAALLALAGKSGENGSRGAYGCAAAAERWAAVGLVALFVRAVAVPLALCPSAAAAVAEAAREHPLPSSALLGALLAVAGAVQTGVEAELLEKGAEEVPAVDVGHFVEQCTLDYFLAPGETEELLADLTAIACNRLPSAVAATVSSP